MLSPKYLESLPVGLVSIYADLESWIIADIARRIAGADYVMTPSAEWQIKKTQEMRLSYDEVVKKVARQTGKTQKEIRKIFEEAGVKALENDSKIYALAGKDPTAFMNSLALNRTFIAGIEQTNGLMKNFTKSLAAQSNKLLGDLLGQAYFEVQSGAWSYQTAVKKAIRQLAKQGVQTVKYPSGHTDQIDVAVRRAIITGVNQTAGKLQWELADEMECDLVETSAHFGARPSHQEWQGQIFSRDGKHSKYPDFKSSTGYGTGEGLCGYNCRHSFFPYYEGISKPIEIEFDVKESNEYYEKNQQQRAYERKIRKQKRQVEALKGALNGCKDDTLRVELENEKKRSQAKLRETQGKLKAFCEENDLARRRERESIVKK